MTIRCFKWEKDERKKEKERERIRECGLIQEERKWQVERVRENRRIKIGIKREWEKKGEGEKGEEKWKEKGGKERII